MANTRSATLSVRLKPETKKRLAKLAKSSGRSSNFLISDAVESYVADQERMLAEIRQADRQTKSGHYIRLYEIIRIWAGAEPTPESASWSSEALPISFSIECKASGLRSAPFGTDHSRKRGENAAARVSHERKPGRAHAG